MYFLFKFAYNLCTIAIFCSWLQYDTHNDLYSRGAHYIVIVLYYLSIKKIETRIYRDQKGNCP